MRRATAIAAGVLVLAIAASASAGYVNHGPVVAKGSSPGGLDWRVKADKVRGYAYVDFEFDDPYSEYGWGTTFPPLLARGEFHANSGSDLGPAGEGDVGGVAGKAVATLRVTMKSGTELEFDAEKAPKSVRGENPWIRSIRFYDFFFDGSEEPKMLSAYDSEGNLLSHSHSHRGLFYGGALTGHAH